MTNYELWIDSYAELLGCANRPTSVAVAISELQKENERIRASIPRHRTAAANTSVREVIEGAIEKLKKLSYRVDPDVMRREVCLDSVVELLRKEISGENH